MDNIDILIVGAGISGISAAVHLKKMCPQKNVRIIEARASIGGTWDLFRYPGIRSDSDMHTLGFSFKPWRDAKSIADGPSILKYVNETVEESMGCLIRLSSTVVSRKRNGIQPPPNGPSKSMDQPAS